MGIERFNLSGINQSKTIKQKVVSGFAQKQGATIQKLTQMFDKDENRTLINDSKVTDNLLTDVKEQLPQLYSKIQSISDNFYQGSIGNVHCVKLIDGIYLAIKSLRPDVQDQITKDLKNLNKVISTTSKFVNSNKFHDMEGFTSKFINSLNEECNFENEIKNHQKLENKLKRYRKLKIPKLYSEYSNNNIISFEWIENNKSIHDLESLNEKDKKIIQEELASFFYLLPLIDGFTQEDSNISNFLVKDSNLYIIDFGKIVFIPLKMRLALARLLEDLVTGNNSSQLEIYSQMGFNKELLAPLANSLEDISKILLEPLLSETSYSFSNWHPSEKIDSIAHNLKWNLRSSAPLEYFALSRSFFGFLKVSNILNVKVETLEIKNQILAFYKKDLQNYRVKTEDKANYKYVNIVVVRSGTEKVNLLLPYETIYDLKHLISDEIKIKLNQRGLSISDLIEKAIADKSSTIFTLEEGKDTYSITLTNA